MSATAVSQIRLKVDQARSSPAPGMPNAQRVSDRRASSLTGDALILPAGAEDRERDPDGLQADICAILDEHAVVGLLEGLVADGQHERVRRLRDVRDRSVCHDWLWRTSPAHGPVVPPEDFQPAVRLRLDASCVAKGMLCPRCGTEMSSTAAHAFCCALPAATKGHYDVRDAVLPLVSPRRLFDPHRGFRTYSLLFFVTSR